jgi:branched-subunit amino acid aminotransferase/4-amino-4-deoxychorismate lyase
MQETCSFVTMLDGREASSADLAPLSFAGFAHFTAMQVREGKVRGLDLHLNRLRTASRLMFGKAHDDADVCGFLRRAVECGPPDLSLTATVFSRSGEFTANGAQDDPAILVRTFPASSGPQGPLRLEPVPHQRALASIKHVGETMKTHALRQAVAKGFDDAAFIDGQGRIAEATIWNLAFRDGETVVWPEADILRGVTMQIVERQLTRSGIAQSTREIRLGDVGSFTGAALMNSWTPYVPVRAIGPVEVPVADDFGALLRAAYMAEPLVSI